MVSTLKINCCQKKVIETMSSSDTARVVVSEASSGDFDEVKHRSRAGSETQEIESSAGSELARAFVVFCWQNRDCSIEI